MTDLYFRNPIAGGGTTPSYVGLVPVPAVPPAGTCECTTAQDLSPFLWVKTGLVTVAATYLTYGLGWVSRRVWRKGKSL